MFRLLEDSARQDLYRPSLVALCGRTRFGGRPQGSLFQRRFRPQITVGRSEALVRLAVDVGMDEVQGRRVLETDAYAVDVCMDL